MKAIVQDTYGSADVLEVRDIAPPSIGEEDVLVRVVAAGVDRGAWHFMTGQPYLMRILGFGFRSPKIPVPGTNVACGVPIRDRRVFRVQAARRYSLMRPPRIGRRTMFGPSTSCVVCSGRGGRSCWPRWGRCVL
jgi:hypothetical protein